MWSPLLTISQVSWVTGLEEFRVKKWSVGDPIEIKPSSRAGGTGESNLYDISNVYRFAVAAQLHGLGMKPLAIKAILEQLPARADLSKPQWLIVSRRGKKLGVRLDSADEAPAVDLAESDVATVINMRRLVAQVEKNISELSKRNERIRRDRK